MQKVVQKIKQKKLEDQKKQVYFGIGPIDKARERRPTAKEALYKKPVQVKYWGIEKIPENILKQYKEDKILKVIDKKQKEYKSKAKVQYKQIQEADKKIVEQIEEQQNQEEYTGIGGLKTAKKQNRQFGKTLKKYQQIKDDQQFQQKVYRQDLKNQINQRIKQRDKPKQKKGLTEQEKEQQKNEQKKQKEEQKKQKQLQKQKEKEEKKNIYGYFRYKDLDDKYKTLIRYIHELKLIEFEQKVEKKLTNSFVVKIIEQLMELNLQMMDIIKEHKSKRPDNKDGEEYKEWKDKADKIVYIYNNLFDFKSQESEYFRENAE